MLGDTIRKLREEKGLKSSYVAEILNVANSTYSGYENNKSEPNYEILIKIADYFDVTIDYLLGRTEYKDGAIIEDIPDELKQIGVEYLEVTKEFKETGLTPTKIKSLIKGLKEAGLIKDND